MIKVRIGRPISVKDQEQHEILEEFSDFIRKKTYMLSNAFENPKILKNISSSIKINKAPKKIITPVNPLIMRSEVDDLRSKNFRLLQSKNYEVYLAPAATIPNIS